MPQDEGRQINMASAAHTQVFYAHVDSNTLARGINGPLFTRQVCGGANFNGALVNPDEFQGRNPLEVPVARAPWQALVGGEHVLQAWPGNPMGLNVRIPTPVKKGDAYRAGTHYRSKNPVFPPTGTTLGLGGTHGPGIVNVEGDGGHTVPTKSYGFMGRSKEACRNDPNNFLKTRTRHQVLDPPKRFRYPDEDSRLPRPPKASESFGSFSSPLASTDYIVKNQVDCLIEGSKEKALQRRSLDAIGPRFPPGGITAPKPQKRKVEKEETQEEVNLSRAQRADFEALLTGKGISSPNRVKKLNEVLVHRGRVEKKRKEQKPARPHTMQEDNGKQTLVESRPFTMSTEYTDTSEATTEFIADNRIVKRLPVDVRRQMIRSMKRQWDEVNKEYQLLTLSLFNLDTVVKVSRKEACEAKMARLEKDIERLSKGHVYIPIHEHEMADLFGGLFGSGSGVNALQQGWEQIAAPFHSHSPRNRSEDESIGVLLDQNSKGTYTISEVLQGGGANLSGQVEVGDVVEAIDGNDLGGLSLASVLSLLLGEVGSECRLSLCRNVGGDWKDLEAVCQRLGHSPSDLHTRRSLPASNLAAGLTQSAHNEVMPGKIASATNNSFTICEEHLKRFDKLHRHYIDLGKEEA